MTNTLFRKSQAAMFLDIQVKLNEQARIFVLRVYLVVKCILILV